MSNSSINKIHMLIFLITACLRVSLSKSLDIIQLYLFPEQHDRKIANLIHRIKNGRVRLGDGLNAAHSLAEIGGASRAVPQLISLLEHSNPQVRNHAVIALGFIGRSAKHAMPKILEILKDVNSDVRYSAVKALGEMGYLTKAELTKLIPLLKDSYSLVRFQTAYVIGEMGKPADSAIQELIPLLNDSNMSVRLGAHTALKQLGYEDAVPLV